MDARLLHPLEGIWPNTVVTTQAIYKCCGTRVATTGTNSLVPPGCQHSCGSCAGSILVQLVSGKPLRLGGIQSLAAVPGKFNLMAVLVIVPVAFTENVPEALRFSSSSYTV